MNRSTSFRPYAATAVTAAAVALAGLALLSSCRRDTAVAQGEGEKTGTVRLYAVDRYENVRRLDPSTLEVIDSIITGPRPHGIVASPDGRTLYITVETSGELLKVDVATHRVLARVVVGEVPNEPTISKDGRYAFVPLRKGNRATIVDTRTMEIVKQLDAGRGEHNSYTSYDGKHVYITSMGDSIMSVVDPESLVITRQIYLGGIPRPVAIKRDETLAYIAISGLTGFITLDLTTDSVTDRLVLPTPAGTPEPPLDTYTHGMLLTPNERELWVAGYATDKVYGFLVPERKQIAEIAVEGGPHWLSLNPDGEPLYVTLERGGAVAAIHTGLREVIKRNRVGRAPTRVLAFRTPVEDSLIAR